MNQHELDIADMQCWVFRMAQTKWSMSTKDCIELLRNITFLISLPNATIPFT